MGFIVCLALTILSKILEELGFVPRTTRCKDGDLERDADWAPVSKVDFEEVGLENLLEELEVPKLLLFFIFVNCYN